MQKPPAKKPEDPEITTFNGLVWKWCDKGFNGCWNRTHVTSEHVAGVRKCNCQHQPPPDNTNDINNSNNNNSNNTVPQANLATVPAPTPSDSEFPVPSAAQANIANVATESMSSLDFL